MDNLPAWVNGSLGLSGIVIVFVYAILRGHLVPVSVLNARIADKDQAIEMWKSAYERQVSALDEKDQQIHKLLEATATTSHVMEAVREAAGRRGHVELGPAQEGS